MEDLYGQSTEKTYLSHDDGADLEPPVPSVKIMRSTTYSQELLTAPSFSSAGVNSQEKQDAPILNPVIPKRSNTMKSGKLNGKRFSNLMHLNRRSRAASVADTPPRMNSDIPPIPGQRDSDVNKMGEEERQAQWEKRATLLVQGTTQPVTLPPSPEPIISEKRRSVDFNPSTTRNTDGPVDNGDRLFRTPSGSQRGHQILAAPATNTEPDKSEEDKSDVSFVTSAPEKIHTLPPWTTTHNLVFYIYYQDDIQRAIHLHESGDLTTSTLMFGRLADPAGANNALAQVLYGLALRHGWGIPPNPELAIQYLTQSARNASQLTSSLQNPPPPPPQQQQAQHQHYPKPHAPPSTLNRGELTLSIYELGNCHRNGWGVSKSPALAMQYFETAAELGDADAMLEVAQAWERGVKGWMGGRKDRKMAAGWYRRAEALGRREVGNSWVWKEKYD